jgi:hypothetical protein
LQITRRDLIAFIADGNLELAHINRVIGGGGFVQQVGNLDLLQNVVASADVKIVGGVPAMLVRPLMALAGSI